MKMSHAQFNTFMNQHYKEIFHFVSKYTSSIEDAKDNTQDIFLKAYNKSHTYNEEKASLRTWIYTIAHNHMINYLRSFHVKNKVPLHDSFFESLSDTDDILEKIIQEEDVHIIITIMKQSLSKKHQKIMGLYFFSNLKTSEIADLTGLKRKTINNVIGLSINKIKKKVEDLNHEELSQK